MSFTNRGIICNTHLPVKPRKSGLRRTLGFFLVVQLGLCHRHTVFPPPPCETRKCPWKTFLGHVSDLFNEQNFVSCLNFFHFVYLFNAQLFFHGQFVCHLFHRVQKFVSRAWNLIFHGLVFYLTGTFYPWYLSIFFTRKMKSIFFFGRKICDPLFIKFSWIVRSFFWHKLTFLRRLKLRFHGEKIKNCGSCDVIVGAPGCDDARIPFAFQGKILPLRFR